jgi:hypothetical protein
MPKRKPPVKIITKRGRPFRVQLDEIPVPEVTLNFDDFYNALLATDEMLSGCGINYVCIGNTLDVIMGLTKQFTEPITLATLHSQLTDYARSALRQLTNPTFEWNGDYVKKIILPIGIIKVEMRVLNGNFRPVKNYDLKYFNYDLWKIPNPIEEFNRILKEINL